MAESDPNMGQNIGQNNEQMMDWAKKRLERAKIVTREQVALIANNTTSMADAPLPLHKSVYMGEKRHQAEKQKLFLEQPIVAGLSGDIAEAGDIMVFDAAGPSILVMRGKDMKVRAFLNMCTHRGAKLIEEKEPYKTNASRISCPFHAWTFSNMGDLIGQPGKKGFAGCEIGARNLIALPCAEYLGLIFVRPTPEGDPIDAADHLGGIAPILEILELQKAQPVKKGWLTADSNWKFALDTYGEGYHFKTLHASTIGQTFYNDVGSYTPFEGGHHHVTFPDLSYGELVDKDESEWPEKDYGGVHFLFPNTIIFFGAITPGVYFTQVFRLFPDGVDKTRCQFSVYAPFGIESDEHKAICEMAYDGTAEVVQTEDYRVASHGYANLQTAPDDFHVVLGANEAPLQDVHKNIAQAIGMPLNQV